MTHYLVFMGKSLTEQEHLDNNLILSGSPDISIACTALRALKSAHIVTKHELKTLGSPAPEECYPFPGEPGCDIFWKPPSQFREEALRFISFLEKGVEQEDRHTFRKSEGEWNHRGSSLISDEELDDLFLQMRKSFMSLADVAARMESLGEDLAILVFS